MAANPILALLRAAFKQIGVPYVWADYNPAGPAGGAGSGFDCSGFTRWALARAGLDLVHNAAAQQSALPSIGRGALRPGDLVFFWYPNSRGIASGTASHVGIYIGDGKMIAASSSADAVQVQEVDWGSFVGGGSVYKRLGNPQVPSAHQINQITQTLGVDVTVHSTASASSAHTARGMLGATSITGSELAGILRGFGLNPGMFGDIIHQAVINQWSPEEFQANLYGSDEFAHAFPGIFNPDGSLKMTPTEWNQIAYGDGGYQDIGRNFGIQLGRNKIGELIGGDVSPTEWQFRAYVLQQAKTSDVYRTAFNQVLKASGQQPIEKGQWFDFIAGKSDTRIENLYEAASLKSTEGLDISAKQALAASKEIGLPGEQVDLKQLVAQIRTVKDFVSPELRAAGITDADLAVLESGADPKNIQGSLQQILRNRQALVGSALGGNVSAPGGGLFPAQQAEAV